MKIANQTKQVPGPGYVLHIKKGDCVFFGDKPNNLTGRPIKVNKNQMKNLEDNKMFDVSEPKKVTLKGADRGISKRSS